MEMQVAVLAADEDHAVMWDIGSLASNLSSAPYVSISTSKLVPKQWPTIDKEYAKTTDVEKPVIMFELPENKAYIADGNHRLYRAAAENIPNMNVIFAPETTHLQYLHNCTDQDYRETIHRLSAEGIFIDNPF